MPKKEEKLIEEEVRPDESFDDSQKFKAPKPVIPYEIGGVYADVKVVKIKPELERSVYFVYAQRDADGGVIKQPKVKKDKVVGFQPKWGEETHSMTPEDFARFVEGRKMTGFMLGTDYAF